MNKHETALRDLTIRLSDLDPVCSILAQGSIGRGEYGPDSDIDLAVISWRFRELADELDWQIEQNLFNCNGGLEVKLDSGVYQGIRLDLHCRSPRNHVKLVMSGPVYRWGGSVILYDPSGIAQWGVECTNRLLADNPDFAARLKRFHDLQQKWKSDKTVKREFETQLDFGKSVDPSALVRNYEPFANQVLRLSRFAPYSQEDR
jgi:predicted nucleotidyltransferase